MTKQTWWQENAENMMSNFALWIGNENATSRVQIAQYIQENNFESVLDVACGLGDDFVSITTACPTIMYTGVDSAIPFLEKAKEKGAEVVCSDIHQMPFSDSSMDVVYGRHILEHLPDGFETVLGEMIRIARLEALIVFFLTPTIQEKLGTDPNLGEDVTLNTYSRAKIEDFLKNHNKVESWEWISVNGSPIGEIILRVKKKEKQPKVAICFGTYNGAEYLPELLDSIKAQTYKNYTVYIWNDGSTDNTREIIEKYSKDMPIKYRNHKGSHVIGTVKNWVIKFALKDNPDFIQIIDHDDRLEPHMIQRMVNRMVSTKADFACCFAKMFGEANSLLTSCKATKKTILRVNSYLSWGMFKASVVKKYNYRVGLKHFEDWDLWVRLTYANKKPEIVGDVLYNYRMHTGQFHNETNKYWESHYKKLLEINGFNYKEIVKA